eukprot:135082_1
MGRRMSTNLIIMFTILILSLSVAIACGYISAENDNAHCEQHHIVVEKFISSGVCNSLIRYFESNINLTKSNINNYYDGRIVYYSDIDNNKMIKNILQSAVENALDLLVDHYDISRELHPDTIQIVKWYEGQNLGEHSDAFYVDGTPNYSFYRKYTMIIYLNNNFEGGEFQFTKRNVTIKPETGKLVAFSAGLYDMHKVNKVLQGNRYTIAAWFTDDPLRALHDFPSRT